MTDRRFFSPAGPFALHQLADIARAEIAGGADPEALFTDVAALDAAERTEVSFLDDRRYADQFAKTRAGACLIRPEMAARAPRGVALLVTKEVYLGYARIAAAFHPPAPLQAGIDPKAVVDPSARVGAGCRIEAGVTIEAGVEIGEGCRIGANAFIGRGVAIGRGGTIGSGASLMVCIVGKRVVIHPGVRIGQDGFGFVPRREGHVKVPQVGRVLIGDDVEIGANSTIDRGANSDTVIGSGCKIDNLVQIGHNVRLGYGCIVVAQVGISGSTVVGNGVMIGGQAGLAGHLHIGDGARIAAQSGVMRDIPPGETVFGYPAVPSKQYMRQVAILGRLARRKEQ